VLGFNQRFQEPTTERKASTGFDEIVFCSGGTVGQDRRFASYCGKRKTPLTFVVANGLWWWCRQRLVHNAPTTYIQWNNNGNSLPCLSFSE